MSTFNGCIREYPILAIDRFIPNESKQYFILSHVHKDHTHGLENLNFNEKVYCTEQTALLLPFMEKRTSKQLMYSHLKELMVPVPYYETIVFEISQQNSIELTFLPANHCPGAALILIKENNGTVLYTGDMRAEAIFVTDKLDYIKKFQIKNLYMDTTCCYAEKRNFISKIASVDLLSQLIQSYSDHHHIYLDCWTVGYEEVWMAVAETFKEKIHVSRQRYTLYCRMNLLFKSILTIDPTSTRFHSCRWDEPCRAHENNMISIHFTPNENTRPIKYIPTKQSKQLLMTDLPYDCKPLEQMIIPFSTHSSLSEIVFFYNFVNPKEFTPCVARGGWKTLNQMRLLLIQEGCRLNTDPSSSDIEKENASSSSSCGNTLTFIANDPQSSIEQSFNYISTCESVSSRVDSVLLFDSKSCNELFITKTNTHKLIKSIKALQKRRGKSKSGAKYNPVYL